MKCMKKIKIDVAVGFSYVALTWFITLYFNGVVNDGKTLYILNMFEGGGQSSQTSLLIQTVLWLLPKLLLSYYLANTLFRSYKNSFAYYFVRNRDSLIWMKRVLIRISLSAILFTCLKLSMAIVIDSSSIYIGMSMVELFYVLFIAIFIFIVLLITDSEKVSTLIMLVVMICTYMVSEFRNTEFIKMIFLYQYPIRLACIYLLLCILGIVVIYQILKRKEYYY